jgi:hypothetical protein
VPEGFTWQAQQRATPGVTVVSRAANLLRARLHFTETDRLAWSFTFDADASCVDVVSSP